MAAPATAFGRRGQAMAAPLLLAAPRVWLTRPAKSFSPPRMTFGLLIALGVIYLIETALSAAAGRPDHPSPLHPFAAWRRRPRLGRALLDKFGGFSPARCFTPTFHT